MHLLTLTVPHDAGVRLGVSFDVVRGAYRDLFSGRARVEDRARFGLEHYIRAHDFTVGANGWHPHIHALLFTTRALDGDDVTALGDRLHERWARSVTRRGLRAPSREYGTMLETARDVSDVARYALQVCVGAEGERARPAALELMRSDLKRSRHDGHRSPWEVLEAFQATGDDDDLQLWHEYEQATQGKHATQWSRGLRQLVDVVERTDEEIVAEEVGGDVVFTFTRGHDLDPPYIEWQAVARTRGAIRTILAAAEAGWRAGGIDLAAIAVTAAVELIYRRFRLSRRTNASINQALVVAT